MQSFSTRWRETIVAMKQQPDDEILESWVLSSASTVRAAQAIGDSVRSRYCSKRDYTRLTRTVVQHLQQKHREKHFSARERLHEKPASGPAAAEGKSKGNGKRNAVIACNGPRKVHVLEDKSVERNTTQRKYVNPRERERQSFSGHLSKKENPE